MARKLGTRLRRRPQFERLEGRSVPAGDVVASVTGGDLVLSGDGSANGVLVLPADAPGTFFVAGFDQGGAPTTVNGQPAVVLNGVNDDFDINLGDGNDALVIAGVSVPDELKVEAGAGDDLVAILASVAGHVLDVNTDQGSDLVYLDGLSVGTSAIEDSHIDTGRRGDPGSDLVIILNSRFEDNFLVELDDGDDGLAVGGSTFLGRFDATGGDGFDVFADLGGNTFADGPHLVGFEQMP